MADYIFSFIGTGNMGGALARAAARKLPPEAILLSNRTPEKAAALAEELKCGHAAPHRAAEQGKYIFLGVKPQMMGDLLAEIGPVLARRRDRFLLVTMAAGLTMERIAAMAGGDYPVIRIMPNTPCAVGEGVILCDANERVTEEELTEFMDDMSGAGVVDRLEERLIDAGSAVSGCGPAFVCLLLEALADGGVAAGLPRGTAIELAAQLLVGSGKMLLDQQVHPEVMKDSVCTPGGSTIAGCRALERGAFRFTVISAVEEAIGKMREVARDA